MAPSSDECNLITYANEPCNDSDSSLAAIATKNCRQMAYSTNLKIGKFDTKVEGLVKKRSSDGGIDTHVVKRIRADSEIRWKSARSPRMPTAKKKKRDGRELAEHVFRDRT